MKSVVTLWGVVVEEPQLNIKQLHPDNITRNTYYNFHQDKSPSFLSGIMSNYQGRPRREGRMGGVYVVASHLCSLVEWL